MLLDTSVVIDLGDPALAGRLRGDVAVSVVTLAELAAGPHLAADPLEAARRQARLQLVEATFDAIPFDVAAARSYGMVVAAAAGAGRTHRSRVADFLIAATAHAHGLAVATRNPGDFAGLEDLVEVVGV